MSVNWRFLACHRHRRDLSLVSLGLLTEADAPAVLQHLADCPTCQRKVAQWRSLVRVGSRTTTLNPILFPTPALRERWTREILDLNPNPPESSAKAPSDVPAPWAIGHLIRQPAGLLATAWLLIAFFWFGAPQISRSPASTDGLVWGQLIAALQPPPPPAPEAEAPTAPPPPGTNDPSPGPLGNHLRAPSPIHRSRV